MADFTSEDKAKEAATKELWGAARATSQTIPYTPGQAFADYWREHYKEMGSPVGREHHHKSGTNTLKAFQAYALGIYQWDPASGVSEVQP